MSRLDRLSPEIQRKLAAAVDDQLTAEELSQLEPVLLEDPQAMRVYWDLSQLTMDLHMRERTRRATKAGLSRVDAAASREQTPPSRQSSSQDMPAAPEKASLRSQSWLARALKHEFAVGAAVSAVFMLVVVSLLYFSDIRLFVADKDDPKPDAKHEFVARLTGVRDAVWQEGTRPARPRLAAGQRLAIQEGSIEIKYRTGARVVIEGPAEFVVGAKITDADAQRDHAGDENSGFLKLGKLVAHVATPAAMGFTIDTPSARVEDLGTEFGVEVDEGGAAEFVVISGKVDLIRESSPGVVAERIHLSKGQGATVPSGHGRITKRAKVDTRLATAMRERLDQVFDTPPPAAAVATHDGAGAVVADSAVYSAVTVGDSPFDAARNIIDKRTITATASSNPGTISTVLDDDLTDLTGSWSAATKGNHDVTLTFDAPQSVAGMRIDWRWPDRDDGTYEILINGKTSLGSFDIASSHARGVTIPGQGPSYLLFDSLQTDVKSIKIRITGTDVNGVGFAELTAYSPAP